MSYRDRELQVNMEGPLLASAARTATVSSADQTLYGRGVRISINCTASASTPSVVPTIEVKDPVSGVYTSVLAGAAITGASHIELVVYPGITVTTNLTANIAMGRTWRVTMTHADTDSITYSVGMTQLI